MSSYTELRARQQKEVNEFPIYFAFGDKRFKELLEKLGLDEDENSDKYYAKHLVSIGIGGGIVLKSDRDAFEEMVKRHSKEHYEAIAKDKDGTGYIYEMFLYELRNHEYGYTGDPNPALVACGITQKMLSEDEILVTALNNAIQTIIKEEEEDDE